MKPNHPDMSSPWWSQTRAALARVFGHVQVRQLEMDTLASGTAARGLEAFLWPAPAAGAQENAWLPSAVVQNWQPPIVPAAGEDLDGTALSCTVSSTLVPHLPETGVLGGNADALSPPVRAVSVRPGEYGAITVLPLAVRLSGGQPCLLPVALPMPPVQAVSVALERSGRAEERSGRAEAGGGGRSGIPAFRAPRLWARLDRITRVPLLRRRMAPPAGEGAAQDFLAERQALAAACGAALEEVKWVASFPRVPLTLVQQMAVTPEGDALRLWLRSDLLESGAGWTAAQVTLVLGRRRGTDKIIRAVLPQTRPAGRKQ